MAEQSSARRSSNHSSKDCRISSAVRFSTTCIYLDAHNSAIYVQVSDSTSFTASRSSSGRLPSRAALRYRGNIVRILCCSRSARAVSDQLGSQPFPNSCQLG